MSSSPSHHILPRQIDLRKFAHQGVRISGEVRLDDLLRLRQAVLSTDATLAVELQFDIRERKLKVIQGHAQGSVEITCQRCLEPMAFDLDVSISVAVIWSEDEAGNLPSDLEPWIADEGQSDVYEVIEEELLLCLPMVAYHDKPCVDKTSFGDEETESLDDVDTAQNPFHVLQQLKGTPK